MWLARSLAHTTRHRRQPQRYSRIFFFLHLSKRPKGVVICCILLDSGNTARQPCFLSFARAVSFEELQIGRSARSTYSYRIHQKSNSHPLTQRETRHSSTHHGTPTRSSLDKAIFRLRLHLSFFYCPDTQKTGVSAYRHLSTSPAPRSVLRVYLSIQQLGSAN